jgi:DNA-binding CsgD family transcriptional regulator
MFFKTEFSVKDLDKYLTKSELLDLLHVLYTVHASRHSIDEEQFKKTICMLKKMVSFDSFLYAYGTSQKELLYSVNVDYPQDYLDIYFEKQYEHIDPVLTVFLQECKIINWHDVDRVYDCRPEGIVNRDAQEFGLLDGYAYGCFDERTIGTYWFSGRYIERSNRSRAIIELIVRCLADPLEELYKTSNQYAPKAILSKKEIEVLSWIKEGKSSWDISMILRISERTVNFHVNNIVTKLNAKNRTHAVAIAVAERLLDI